MSTPADHPASGSPEPGTIREILRSVALLASLFSILVCATMLYLRFHAASSDPWTSPQLLALKSQLEADPKNDALKNQIRSLDYKYRRTFHHRLAMNHSGAWLLLGGAFLAVFAARFAVDSCRQPALPSKAGASVKAQPSQSQARAAVAIAGSLIVAGLAVTAFFTGPGFAGMPASLISPGSPKTDSTAESSSGPSASELQENWPGFRGWDGSGVTASTNYPLAWDAKTGTGIAWSSPVLAPGKNSPVVWNNRVFLTGAVVDKREVFSFDAATGRLQWRTGISHVPGSPLQQPEVGETTTYAAPTGVTDGKRFYAIFANGDLAAVNFDGTIAWTKAFGPVHNQYGHAASLAMRNGLVVVQLDQNEERQNLSKIIAVDAATGTIRWQKSRPVPSSWSSPIVIETAGKMQVIALGEPWVMAYSLAGGAELWRAELIQNEVVPSPVFLDGLLVAASPSSKVLALRADGTGDVTKSAVAWRFDEDAPDITSPVCANGLAFVVSSGGGVTCLDLKDGKKIWNHDLEFSVQSSPSIMGNRLLVLGENGVAVQMKAGREFKELGRGQLADTFTASPAFATGRIFLRGETNLYCIGAVTNASKGAQARGGD